MFSAFFFKIYCLKINLFCIFFISILSHDCTLAENTVSSDYFNNIKQNEKKIIRKAVHLLLPQYSFKESSEALKEILAVHHLVYHETRWHKIKDNVFLARQYEWFIKKICRRYEVPFHLAMGIMVWENSGGSNKMSYSGNIGFGQLGNGAVNKSHAYAAKIASKLQEKAHFFYQQAKITGEKAYHEQALAYQRKAREYDLYNKHKYLAKKFMVKDERQVPYANIEDSIIFLKFLLDGYPNQPDLAITAYHNGMQNMDDLVCLYLRKKGLYQTCPNDETLLKNLISQNKITYLSLWKDQHVREVMNGLRAVNGSIASKENKSDTLGDESDLYLWKIIGALGAYLTTEDMISQLKTYYAPRKDQVDSQMLPIFDTEDKIKKGLSENILVYFEHNNFDTSKKKWICTKALAGLIHRISAGINYNKRDTLELPVISVLKPLSYPDFSDEDIEGERAVHPKGIAVDLDLTNHPNLAGIRKILKWWYHFDRIYLTRLPIPDKVIYHISINPQYLKEFEQFAPKSKGRIFYLTIQTAKG